MTLAQDLRDFQRKLIADREEFIGDDIKGVWRYRNNSTLYVVRVYDTLVMAWAECSQKWYEVRQKHTFEYGATRAPLREDYRPHDGTTLIDYDAMKALWMDPSTPPEVAALMKVSP
jgi:hypothetical protein